MDTIPIVFSVVIPLNLLVFLHHLYYSTRYIPNQEEKIYYYLTSIIPLTPAVMYSFSLVNYFVDTENYYDSRFLDVFFKTWIVSNPLLLMNLGKVVNIKLYKYMLLIVCDILMYISGYISYRTHDRDVYITTLVISSLCFIGIMWNIIHAYYYHHNPQADEAVFPFYQRIMKFIIVTWVAYPIVFLLFKEGVITLETIALAYIALDFITKTVFTSIIIQYHRIINRRKSFVNYQTRIEMNAESHQVVPVELTPLPYYNEISPSASPTITMIDNGSKL